MSGLGGPGGRKGLSEQGEVRMLLEGQVVLVTGAGRGIGRAVALAFSREGARVAVTGRTEERRDRVAQEIVAAGGEALPFALDVTRDD